MIDRNMTRDDFRIAYREARKVRKLELTFLDRLGNNMLSIADNVPSPARTATLRYGDALRLPMLRSKKYARSRITFKKLARVP